MTFIKIYQHNAFERLRLENEKLLTEQSKLESKKNKLLVKKLKLTNLKQTKNYALYKLRMHEINLAKVTCLNLTDTLSKKEAQQTENSGTRL